MTVFDADTHPDGYSDEDTCDDDGYIYFTWDYTGNPTECRAELNDPTPDEDAGLDKFDTDWAWTSGLHTYYVECCDGTECESDSDVIEVNKNWTSIYCNESEGRDYLGMFG